MAAVALQPRLVSSIEVYETRKRLDFGGYVHVMLTVYDIIIIL